MKVMEVNTPLAITCCPCVKIPDPHFGTNKLDPHFGTNKLLCR